MAANFPDILDLNMGCPVPKVVRNGDGSALMKNPRLAGDIIEKTAKAIKKPVTVKIRKGFDDAHVNAVEMALWYKTAFALTISIHTSPAPCSLQSKRNGRALTPAIGPAIK